MPDVFQIDRPGEVYAKGYAPKPAWERYGIPRPPLMDLLPVPTSAPSKPVLFSVPSNIVDRSVAFVTGDPFAGSSYTILAAVATSGTPASMEMRGWRKLFDEIRLYGGTQFAVVVDEPRLKPFYAPIYVDPAVALREVLAWTELRPATAAQLFGASRRSIYNWLGGGRIQDDFRRRIVRFREILQPIADSRDPIFVAEWLDQGDPAPAALVRDERWDELVGLVEATTRPLRPLEGSVDSRPEAEPAPYSPEARRATLRAFSTAPAGQVTSRKEWRPRELTGLEANESDED
jgi:hypothetical protein